MARNNSAVKAKTVGGDIVASVAAMEHPRNLLRVVHLR
jgi:hypothetical protein